MQTTTITSKGQTTVPVDIREALGLKEGGKITWSRDKDGRITVRAKTRSIWDSQGIIPKPKKPVTIEDMNRAIAQMGRLKK